MHALPELIRRFESLTERHGAGVPHSLRFPGGVHGFTVTFGALIHGNETGSLPAIVDLAERLAAGTTTFGGNVQFFLGNVPAARKGVRFVEADLNRVFGGGTDSAEGRRALELRPLLDASHLFVDFHQTLQPCREPFYIFGFHRESYLWARIAGGARVLVTRNPKAAFSPGSLCADEYARSRGIPAVTLELGEKGINPQAEALTSLVLRRVLTASQAAAQGRAGLEKLARRNADLKFCEIVHREPFASPRLTLKPGLHNFSRVSRNEALGDVEENEIRAPRDGFLLFPQYPQRNESGEALAPVPAIAFHLATSLEEHPMHLWADGGNGK